MTAASASPGAGGRRREAGHAFGLRSPHEYLEVPMRRLPFVVVPTAVVLLAAAPASFALPERYRSSTLILVESEKVPDSFVPKIATTSMTRRLQNLT